MATLEQLAEGIKRAHAAGDAASVQKLGTAYRAMQAGGGADMPPAGAKPGSRAYADWAMEQARAGKKLPQFSENPGLAVSDAEQAYEAAMEKYRRVKFPEMSPGAFRERTGGTLAPYGAGELADQGRFFGFSDEIAAGVDAAVPLVTNLFGAGPDAGEMFNVSLELEQARRDLGREQMGLMGTVAEVAGGLSAFGPGGGPATAAAGLAPAAAPAVAPSLLRTTAQGAATGASAGAIAGFGSTDGDFGDRATGAGWGAAGGGILGAALPAAGALVGRGIETAANSRVRAELARRMGIDPAAANFIRERTAASGALGAEGRSAMRAAGPEGMLADASPEMAGVLDYAIQKSGAAGRQVRTAIEQRVGRDGRAINDALDTAFGTPAGVETTRAGIRNATAAGRGNSYDAAYARPIDYSSQGGQLIEELLQRVPGAAINRANVLMRARGETSSQIMARIADDGSVTFETMPDVRQLDYITRALNEEAADGIGAGAMGGQTALGSTLENLSGDIRNVLGNLVPEYRQALNVGAEAIRQTQAVRNGADLFRATREEVAAATANLTPAERQFYAQGVRSHLDEALANVQRTVLDGDVPAREAIAALKKLSSRANREKVAMVIGDDAAEALFSRVDQAAQSFNLRASVATNSRTFARQAMDEQVKAITDPDTIITALGKGRPANAFQRSIQSVTGLTPAAATARQDQLLAEVARILTMPANQGMRIAAGLNRMGNSTANNSAAAQAIRARLGSLVAPASGQGGQRVTDWLGLQ